MEQLVRLNENVERVIKHLDRIATHIEKQAPLAEEKTEHFLENVIAYRWQSKAGAGVLKPVINPGLISFNDLKNVDEQKQQIEQNTRQFVGGFPANNVLLTGARGTGKSSLVRACLTAFHAQGLRLIEVEKEHLNALPEILDCVRTSAYRFIIFCDDLSFEAGETSYKGLKTVLEGSIVGSCANVLVYATSNRRHLLPEYESNNLSYTHSADGELHPGDVIEETISLSDRFGLWISFLTFTQDQYLKAVEHWLKMLDSECKELSEEVRKEALIWALQRGSRSGRIAWQFARDAIGQKMIKATI
ncbi:MAG: ATP-binding protein [Pseudomonadota bacterium]